MARLGEVVVDQDDHPVSPAEGKSLRMCEGEKEWWGEGEGESMGGRGDDHPVVPAEGERVCGSEGGRE